MKDKFVEKKLAEGFEVINDNEPVQIRDWLRTALTEAIEHGKEEAEFENKKLHEMTAFSEGKEEGRKEIQELVKKVEKMKRTDETHLSADHVYDEALNSVLKLLREVIKKKV